MTVLTQTFIITGSTLFGLQIGGEIGAMLGFVVGMFGAYVFGEVAE